MGDCSDLNSKAVMEATEETRMRLVDENKVPMRKLRAKEWLDILQRIPPGKAWAIDPEADRINPGNAKAMVNHLIRTGRLSRSYHVVSETRGGVFTVYVLNSAKEATK